jgi:hypothetical protein
VSPRPDWSPPMLEQILDVTDNIAVAVGILAVLATPFWFAAGLIDAVLQARFLRRQRKLAVEDVDLWSEGVESGLRRRGEA